LSAWSLLRPPVVCWGFAILPRVYWDCCLAVCCWSGARQQSAQQCQAQQCRGVAVELLLAMGMSMLRHVFLCRCSPFRCIYRWTTTVLYHLIHLCTHLPVAVETYGPVQWETPGGRRRVTGWDPSRRRCACWPDGATGGTPNQVTDAIGWGWCWGYMYCTIQQRYLFGPRPILLDRV
jgi:hypothetical protein